MKLLSSTDLLHILYIKFILLVWGMGGGMNELSQLEILYSIAINDIIQSPVHFKFLRPKCKRTSRDFFTPKHIQGDALNRALF
jgi:hypothetical protein